MGKRLIKIVVGLGLMISLMVGGMKMIIIEDTPQESATVAPQPHASMDPTTPRVIIDENGIKTGREHWDSFLKASCNKSSSCIWIQYQYVDLVSFHNKLNDSGYNDVYVQFDGNYYHYFTGNSTKTYQYLSELSGRRPNDGHLSTNVILSNRPYSFEEINELYSAEELSKSAYGSDAHTTTDHQMLYQPLFSY